MTKYQKHQAVNTLGTDVRATLEQYCAPGKTVAQGWWTVKVSNRNGFYLIETPNRTFKAYETADDQLLVYVLEFNAYRALTESREPTEMEMKHLQQVLSKL